MATTKFYLDLRGKAKDGKGSILIILAHNQTTTSFSTGVRIFPSQWNGSSVIKLQEKEAINANLIKRKEKIDKKLALLATEERFQSMTAAQLKAEIQGNKERNKPGRHLIKELFSEYISLGMKENIATIYRLTLKKIIEFSGPTTTIDDIDYRWLLQFDRFLSKNQSVNGRSIYLRALRAIYNYALHIEITQNYPFRLFSIKSEPTRKRSITIENLRRFREYPTNEDTRMYRDYFFSYVLSDRNKCERSSSGKEITSTKWKT